MPANQNNTIVHLDELLKVFNDIDSRIRELHQNSSQVFLQLNDFLKDYYRKNSILSSNATQIFDTIAGNKDSCLTCEINSIFNEYENYKIETDNELDKNLSTYNQLNNKISNISILIRNFKQDLTTLKFLTTNYKIVSGKETSDSVSLESVMEWEKAIEEIHPWLTEIGREISNLSVSLEDLYNNTSAYSQNSVNNNFNLYEELKSAIAIVNKKNLESKNYIPVLKERINSSSESIGNIITHLQYHDIIRQKVEHIQQSHCSIIDNLKVDIEKSGKKIIEEDDRNIPLIADVSGLQAAQLILISREYQEALEVISDNFQKIADDLTAVSTISHEFSFESNNSETTLLNIVKGRLDKSLLLLDEYNSNTFFKELSAIKKQIITIHQDANNRIIKPFEKIAKSLLKIKGTNRNISNDNDSKPNIVDQITTLRSEIAAKREELEKELLTALNLAEKFQVEIDAHGFRSKLEKEQIRIMVNISKTLDRLDDESKQLDSVLLQNTSIKKDIIERLKETLTQADYYELFEKVLNAIIEQLNTLNSRLSIDGNQASKTEKIQNLKNIEAYYTVASERIIHDKVINDIKDVDIPPVSKSEENFELF
jgi:hypothetical protein